MSMILECGPRPAARPAARPAPGSAARSGARTATRAVTRPEAAAPMRLTPRGRRLVRVLFTGALLFTVGVAVLLLNRPAQAGSDTRPLPATYHVVLPGETLWKIAAEVAPRTDPRATVDELMEFNALDSGAVSVGQRIAIPGDLHR